MANESITAVLTCNTPGCGNAGSPITVEWPEDAKAICGVCSVEITDIVKT